MNRSLFERLRPYFLEHWYPRCAPFSIPTTVLSLSTEEAQALSLPLAVPSHGRLDALNTRLALAMHKLTGDEPAFVRLGSRSPKDVPDFRVQRGQTRLSFEALGWLRTSRRIADDLAMCRRYGYPPTIAIRQWLDIPLWSEFRCFVRDGEILGLSQFHVHLGPSPEIISAASKIETALRKFVTEFVTETERRDGALDVFVQSSNSKASQD